MRSIVVVLFLLVVVGAVAVSGSRAQPLQQTSAAFSQCHHAGRLTVEARCKPGSGVVPSADEVDVGDRNMDFAMEAGAGNLDGDRYREWVQLAVVALDFVVSNWDKFWGSAVVETSSVPLSDALFDPVK
jgi:hypothetical protein